MPKTILFLAASPTDQAKLRLDVEEREIGEGLQRSRLRDEFILVNKPATRPKDMLRALMEHKPWIAHFSGHGGGDEGLVLENDDGHSSKVRGDSEAARSLGIDTSAPFASHSKQSALDEIFSLLGGKVECVLLNACYSEVQARVIAQHIPCVIGMKQAVADTAAITFSAAFYDALGSGENLEQAFYWAKAAVHMEHGSGADIPVMFLRGQMVTQEPASAELLPADATTRSGGAKQPAPDFQYDVFISYRFTQRDWAEALAHNLVAQGYKVFIDAWELYGGQHFTQVIEQALKASRCAILIATPEAADSGWVQHEYEMMFSLEKKATGFFFIPVVWGEFPDFPFLETLHAVDFGDSNEAKYREAFQRLLSALQKQAPGSAPYFDGLLKLPVAAAIPAAPVKLAQKQRSFVDDIFTYVDGGMPVMVLAQEGFNTQHYAQALKEKAEARYGENNVLHLFPPASLKASSDQYFARLGKQCGFESNITSSWEWAEALEQRLLDGDELFLLVTGFENGAEDARRDLAGELRGLIEAHPLEFRLVMIGGERLAAMKYEQGAMSFLNKLEEVPLPSVCMEDVRALYLARQGELPVSDAVLAEVLAFSGQHPRLVEACLRALERGQDDWQAAVMASSLPTQLFARFREAAEQGAMCANLQREELGWYSTWPQDALIRRLYWQNLLRGNDKGRLVWRCTLITRIGKELLGC
ncbi:MAG: TIR domain-containing protein [Thiothrix sp.]|uniref:TIR domain-containing protein n=1 Tax=Thiothrix sp. TaxID=1032 RepID=UPI0026125B80|nr:TIR domain-containing protein [Thiothrix sp.]MDD5391643.1 TIR domain-containing protein [Thiothrix sp.]